MTESGTPSPDLIQSAKADKLALALLARQSQLNQSANQMVLDHNRRFRENQQRIMESRMDRFGAKPAGEMPKGDVMGDIFIDSPITNNPPVKSSAGLSTLAKLAIGTAALLGTGGIGTGIWAALRPAAAVQAPAAPDPSKLNIKVTNPE